MTGLSLIRRYALVVLLVGALTRFVALSSPREVIFDEVTFGKFITYYCCTHERFFDMHPPHGRGLVALGALAGGYDGSFTFEKIGQPYGDQPVFWFRFVPALTGVLIPWLFFLLLRELGATPVTSLVGGVLVALDNALITETRIIVFDGVLVAATLGAIVCFLIAQRHPRRTWWLLGAGALAGLAIGAKWTGLAGLGLIFACLMFGLGVVTGRASERFRQALLLLAPAFVVYVAGWIIHWAVLVNPGQGDAFYPTTGNLVQDFVEAQRVTWIQNKTFAATHPDGSKPWTWPLMKIVPYFWQGEGRSIHMLGNPVVWWGSFALLVGIVAQLFALRPLGVSQLPAPVRKANPWPMLVAYAFAFLPLFPITRVMFMYHYLTPLVFGLAFVMLWLDRGGWSFEAPFSQQPRRVYLVLAAGIIGFLLVMPVTYGFSMGSYDEWLAETIRSWR